MKQIKIVMLETYFRQIKSWAFVVMVLAPFLFIGISVLMGQVGSTKGPEIGLVASKEEQGVLNSQKNFKNFLIEKKARKEFDDKSLSAYVVVENKDGQLEATYYGTSSMKDSDKAILLQGLQALQNQLNQNQAQLSNEQTAILNRQIDFKEKLADKSVNEHKIAQQISLFAMIFIMYFLLLIYSSMTAQEIAGEKGTKIMEVIFSSIPAKDYFYGRILGILAVIVTHIALYVVAGVLAFSFLADIAFLAPFKGVISQVLAQFSWLNLSFVILGLLLYVILSAFCGALVTRAEDANKAVQPVMYLIMFCFFGGIALGQAGDSILLKVGSYFPLTSTFFMPIRLINESAGFLEGFISLLVLLLFVLGLAIYIAHHYAGLILQTDDLGVWKSLKRSLSHK
ncbi:ABC transporter permease [Streptococcus massiliensis]|uniref:Putative ABC transporter, permease component n=1 Tax=Streptococcus massiliensis TaxID=313439 RepID=A0A380KY11_9STRE|nr:ABC transporter permease [Streptococcus massiliensis]SUN76862.1 putative ABC transporter, permease component [Streptococcus massiliensis]